MSIALADTRKFTISRTGLEVHDRMEHPVPEADVLIHAGDFCGRGRDLEVRDFAAWMGAMPHRHKIVTPGNHDSPVENDAATFREVFAAHGIRLLINETVEIEGFRFFGSPYTPTFLNWHFMRDGGPAIRAEWETIPGDADVVITHGPAYGHGDLAPPWKGDPPRHVGCLELLNRLRTVRPLLHVFGHIHDGYGVTISDEIRGTTFLNASVCTEAYRPQTHHTSSSWVIERPKRDWFRDATARQGRVRPKSVASQRRGSE